ncbi:MAG TPA: hypothetical protein VLG69_01925 [Candidatus Andersenbacteria bacterium]|nr:hypothetical protein [Candidatus Andersenbacteria bacterium]
MIAEAVQRQIVTWIDSTYAEQPILVLSHNEEQILALHQFAIQHAFPGKQSASGNHPDAIILISEKDKISVKDIRAIKASLATRPSSGKRIVCIPHAEQLLPESASMLLKTLEESGISTRFLLGSPAKRSVLPTIASRCIVISLTPDTFLQDERTLHELLAHYATIRPSGDYKEEELLDIARLIRAYMVEYGSNPVLARVAHRLRDYYRTEKIPGGNTKLASDILLASLLELRNTKV